MFKVVFCGDAAVGKTTLIMRLCKGEFMPSINSTLGVDFQNKQLDVDGKRIAIQLWDTAGQERFKINSFLLFLYLNQLFFIDFVVLQNHIFVDVMVLFLFMIQHMNDHF